MTAPSIGLAVVAAAALAVTAPVACSSSDEAPTSDAGVADGAGDETNAEGGEAGVDPSRNADPVDLDAGDPSLDIAGSWIYSDKGQPWVRVEFNGAWPTPATLYYWSCSILLGTANAPVVTFSVQSLNGTQSDSIEGLDRAKVTFAVEPKGFRVLFADASLAFDRYGLECGVKKAKSDALAQDTSGTFDATAKKERPFGP